MWVADLHRNPGSSDHKAAGLSLGFLVLLIEALTQVPGAAQLRDLELVT